MSREQKSGSCFFKKGLESQGKPSMGEGSFSPLPPHSQASFFPEAPGQGTNTGPYPASVRWACGKQEASCRAWRRGGGLGHRASSALSAAGPGEPRWMRGSSSPGPWLPHRTVQALQAAGELPSTSERHQ